MISVHIRKNVTKISVTQVLSKKYLELVLKKKYVKIIQRFGNNFRSGKRAAIS
jgi:hypothetical protein